MTMIEPMIASRPLRRIATLALPACALLVLASCGSVADRTTTGSVDDYRERHPIVISEAEHAIEIPVAANDRNLTVDTREVIRGFAISRVARSQGTVQVLYPQGAPNSDAARSVAAQLRAELKRGGIEPRYVIEGGYPANGGVSAPIRLSYVATAATVASTCGEWPKNIAPNLSNTQYQNFGCAYQNNLAAQIANPSDLIGPRAMTPPDAQSRANALDRYRTKFTELKELDTGN